MARLLLIGGPAPTWAQELESVAGEQLELLACRLPSEGIRHFQQSPPDLVLIVDTKGGDRVQVLARALLDRPLGTLVPIAIHAPAPNDKDAARKALGLACWFDPSTTAQEVHATVCELLHLDDEVAPLEPEHQDRETTSYLDGELVLESVEPQKQPSSGNADSLPTPPRISPSAAATKEPRAVDRQELERLLKAVRHDDYYTILDIRRGADSQRIRQAYQARQSRFDPQQLPFELSHTYQDELDEIADALDDAYAVLGDPDLRRDYLEAILQR